MRIISRLFRMFSSGGRRGATTRSRGMGTATRTRGGGLMSKVRRFLR